MGDVGDLWRELKEESKEHRRQKQDWSTELLMDWCAWNEVEITVVQLYHLRLVRGGKKIDIFPQSQRYFDLVKQKWGKYKELISFISNHFGVAHVQIKPFKEDKK